MNFQMFRREILTKKEEFFTECVLRLTKERKVQVLLAVTHREGIYCELAKFQLMAGNGNGKRK